MTQTQVNNSDLREIALSLFKTGVEAADPYKSLQKHFKNEPLSALPKGRYLVIALGKAACSMAQACLEALPQGTSHQAIVVTNYENAEKQTIEGAQVFAAGHPVPDENGLKAGRAVMDLLATSTEDDKVIILISGGGSALLPAPIDGITLEDKIAVNKILLANGYAIGEMNLIRQTLSKTKGGGLARLASPAPVESFILSDVVGDDLSTIASGPTSPALGTAQDALALFDQKGLRDALPTRVIEALTTQSGKQAPALSSCKNHLIGSNRISLDAILATLPKGWRGQIVDDLLEGDVEDVAPMLYDMVSQAPDGEKNAYIWGGETTVTLKGDGVGGRNQELALRFTLLAENGAIKGNWIFLSGGTDGRDGPTLSAGGLVDAETPARIRQKEASPEDLLANNDSYKALDLSGDHIRIGATGTNVADIQICLIDKT